MGLECLSVPRGGRGFGLKDFEGHGAFGSAIGDGKIKRGLAVVVGSVDARACGEKRGYNFGVAIECCGHEGGIALWAGGLNVCAEGNQGGGDERPAIEVDGGGRHALGDDPCGEGAQLLGPALERSGGGG